MQKKSVWQRFGIFFYDKWRYTSLLIAVVAGFGLVAYTTMMRREGFPSVEIPVGFVQVVSLGSDAKSNDQTFALPIIEAAKQANGFKKVQASSSEQGSAVSITFKDGTDVQSELNKLEAGLKDKLPQNGARVVYVKINASKFTPEGDDLLVSVHDESSDAEAVDKKAAELASMIKSAGLSQVKDVHNFPSFERNVNPVTGESKISQVRFDRFYDQSSDKFLTSTLVGVTGVDKADQLKLYDQVNEFLHSARVKDANIDGEIALSFAENIREQISGLQRNLLEGLAVVLLVSFILISFRSSIVTALSMTITVLGTVAVLYAIGYSLNTITLFSLVLCLALIVDDTTIMVEAIDAGFKKGKKYRDTVLEAIGKVIRASATGTLATMLAFAPMLFIGGILGKFIKAIPVTIITSLGVSLLVSFIFIPLLKRATYGKIIKHKKREFHPAGKIEEALGNRLSSTLRWSDQTRQRRILMRLGAVMVGLSFLVAGGLIFSKVKFNIFPSPKDGTEIVVTAKVKNSEAASIDSTSAVTDRSLLLIKDVLGDDLRHLSLVGNSGSASSQGYGANIRLSPMNERKTGSVDLSRKLETELNASVPEMFFKVTPQGAGPPPGSFSVQVNADNEQQAYILANDVKKFLETTSIKRPDGSEAKFIESSVTPSVIVTRSGNQRVVTVDARFNADDTSALVQLGQKLVEDKYTAGYIKSIGAEQSNISFDFGFEEENQESFASMGKAAGPLFLAMFLIMAILFRSLLQPILILTALPFAFFGVAAGLYLTKNEISFFSMLGVFALIGISLNNTILLTDYANHSRDKGLKPSEAMAAAIKERLRPLLTTSITSVLALLPLALNDPFWEGLAYALIFGLISSTLLVLLVFPYFYLIDESFNSILGRVFRKVLRHKTRKA